jgi:hypothetical protein
MTSNEAHHIAFHAAANLAKWGIKTNIRPCCLSRKSESALKFSGPERASSDQWCNIVFYPSNNHQVKMINSIRESLFDQGMYFDYGFGLGETTNELEEDWQLDWSFRYPAKC